MTKTKEKTLTVVMCKPGETPCLTTLPFNLKAIHNAVGGNIKIAAFYGIPTLVIVCNDKGKSKGLEPCIPNGTGVIFGPCFICAKSENGFKGLSPAQIAQLKRHIFFITKSNREE